METISREQFYTKTRRLSFFAALSVLYIHSENQAQFGILSGPGYEAQWKLINLASWAVPFFFLLSGYLFFQGFSLSDLLPKWRRRIRTLLLPYLLWNGLYFCLFALLPRLPVISSIIHTAAAPLTFRSILEGLLLHTYDGQMWYVRILLLFTLLAPVFYGLLCRRYAALGFTGILLCLTLFRVPFPLPIAYMSWQNLFYYSLGACLGLHAPDLPFKLAPVRGRRLALPLFFLLMVIQYFTGLAIYPLLAVFLLYIALGDGGRSPDWEAHSFFYFGAHMLVLSPVKKVLLALLPHTDLGMTAGYLLAPLFAMALLIPTAHLAHRFLPRLFSLFTGGRSRR